jgi:hypothetical protein
MDTISCVGTTPSPTGYPTINLLAASLNPACATQPGTNYLLDYNPTVSGSWGAKTGGAVPEFTLVSVQNTNDTLLAAEGLTNLDVSDQFQTGFGGKRHGIRVTMSQIGTPAGLYTAANAVNDLALTVEATSFDNGTPTKPGSSFQNIGNQAWLHCRSMSSASCAVYENLITGQENDVSIERFTPIPPTGTGNPPLAIEGSVTIGQTAITLNAASVGTSELGAGDLLMNLATPAGVPVFPVFPSGATVSAVGTVGSNLVVTMSAGAIAPLTASSTPVTFGSPWQAITQYRYGAHFVAYGSGEALSGDAALAIEATAQGPVIANVPNAFNDNGAWWSGYSADGEWPINYNFGTFSGYYAGKSSGQWANPTGYAMWDARNTITSNPFAAAGFAVEQAGAADINGLRLGTLLSYSGGAGTVSGSISAASSYSYIDPTLWVMTSAAPHGAASGSGYIGNVTCVATTDDACVNVTANAPAVIVVNNTVTLAYGGDLLFDPGCPPGIYGSNNVQTISDGTVSIAEGVLGNSFSIAACNPGTTTYTSFQQSAGTFGGFVLQVTTADQNGKVDGVNIVVPGYWRGSTPPSLVFPAGGHGGNARIDLGWTQLSVLKIAPNGGTVDFTGAAAFEQPVMPAASATTGSLTCATTTTPGPTLLTGAFNDVTAGGGGYVRLQSGTGSAQRVYNTTTASVTVCPDLTHEIQLYSSGTAGSPGAGVALAAYNTAQFVVMSGSLVLQSP